MSGGRTSARTETEEPPPSHGLSANYRLGMPQMLFGGISERWITKEAGDVHWRLICRDLMTPSERIVDRQGERLYASFLRVRWEASHHLRSFSEGESLQLNASTSRFAERRYFSNLRFSAADGRVIEMTLNSAFVSRASDNKSLAKSAPRGIERARSPSAPKLPAFGEQYQLVKLRSTSGQVLAPGPFAVLAQEAFEWTDDVVFSTEYHINPYHDLNGVNLLYFASYHRIHDVCERLYLNQRPDLLASPADWALQAAPVARDVFFYGNADCGQRLLFRLHSCEVRPGGRVKLYSALYRADDGVRIADIFTVKNLIGMR